MGSLIVADSEYGEFAEGARRHGSFIEAAMGLFVAQLRAAREATEGAFADNLGAFIGQAEVTARKPGILARDLAEAIDAYVAAIDAADQDCYGGGTAAAVRDFTDETYQRFRGAIMEGREEALALKAEVAALGEGPAAEAAGDLVQAVVDYCSGLAQRHGEACEALDKVWADVYQAEADALPAFLAIRDRYDALVAEFQALLDLIQPAGGTIRLALMPLADLEGYLLAHSSGNEEAADLVMQAKVLALLGEPEFSQEAWDALSDAGREELLRKLYARVREVLGIGEGVELVFARKESPDDPLGGFQRFANNGAGQITVYRRLLRDYGREDVMRALIHESRHAYQWEAAVDQKVMEWIEDGNTGDYPLKDDRGSIVANISTDGYQKRHPYISETTASTWSKNFRNYVPSRPVQPDLTPEELLEQHRRYVRQPIEFDAWSFAGELDPEVWVRMGNALDELYRLNPTYPGSWDVPQRP